MITEIKRPVLSHKFIITFDHIENAELSRQIIWSSIDIKNKKVRISI